MTWRSRRWRRGYNEGWDDGLRMAAVLRPPDVFVVTHRYDVADEVPTYAASTVEAADRFVAHAAAAHVLGRRVGLVGDRRPTAEPDPLVLDGPCPYCPPRRSP